MSITLHKDSFTSKDEFDKNFYHIAYDLPKDNLYHFSISLKKNWRLIKIDITEPTEQIPRSRIALFRRVEEPTAEIDVEAFLTPRDIHPVDYLEIWLSNQEYKLNDKRVFNTEYGYIGDFLYTLTFEGKTFICRSLTIKDGNRIFIITCRIENSITDIINEEFLIALQTFSLLNPSRNVFAESYLTYDVTKPINMSFVYPESWRVTIDKTPIQNGTSVNLKNLDSDNQVAGSISFVVVPKSLEPDHNDLYLYYLEQLKDNSVIFDKIELEELDVEENNRQWLAIIPCSIGENKYEIVVSILEQYNTIIFTALLGVAKYTSHIFWAFNKKALYNLTESLQLVD